MWLYVIGDTTAARITEPVLSSSTNRVASLARAGGEGQQCLSVCGGSHVRALGPQIGCPPYTDEETEAERGEIISLPGSPSSRWWSWDQNQVVCPEASVPSPWVHGRQGLRQQTPPPKLAVPAGPGEGGCEHLRWKAKVRIHSLMRGFLHSLIHSPPQ